MSLYIKTEWNSHHLSLFSPRMFSSVCVCVCVWVCFPDKWECGVWSLSRGLQASQRLVSRLLSDMSWWDYRKRVSVLPSPLHPSICGGDTRWNWGSLCVCKFMCVCLCHQWKLREFLQLFAQKCIWLISFLPFYLWNYFGTFQLHSRDCRLHKLLSRDETHTW